MITPVVTMGGEPIVNVVDGVPLIGATVLLLGLGVVSLISGALGRSFLGDIGLPAWLVVDQPHPELPAEEVFHLFGFPVTNTMIGAWISIIVLVGISYTATRKMRLIPSHMLGDVVEGHRDLASSPFSVIAPTGPV